MNSNDIFLKFFNGTKRKENLNIKDKVNKYYEISHLDLYKKEYKKNSFDIKTEYGSINIFIYNTFIIFDNFFTSVNKLSKSQLRKYLKEGFNQFSKTEFEFYFYQTRFMDIFFTSIKNPDTLYSENVLECLRLLIDYINRIYEIILYIYEVILKNNIIDNFKLKNFEIYDFNNLSLINDSLKIYFWDFEKKYYIKDLINIGLLLKINSILASQKK